MNVRTMGRFIGFVTGKVIALCRWVCRIDFRHRVRWELQLVGWKFLFRNIHWPAKITAEGGCATYRPQARRWDFNRGRHWDRKRR